MRNFSFEKLGLVFDPKGILGNSYSMLPTPLHLEGDDYQMYFSSRDNDNRSLIYSVRFTMQDMGIRFDMKSVKLEFGLGERGCFDDNGVTPSCVIKRENEEWLYYIGWNSGNSTRRMSLIAGLAIKQETYFERFSRAPLLPLTNEEPFSILTAPYVIRHEKKWLMFYVSCEGWINKDLPRYNIKIASSLDGKNWERNQKIAIDFASENETALARPWVIKMDKEWIMFFSYKDPSIGYRIGLASSKNCIDWTRSGDAVIDVSTDGWDSEMVQYSSIFEHRNEVYMFYNGNGYGATGVGLARLKL